MGGPLLSTTQQIQHSKSKGISFKFISENEAADYLDNNITYYKVRSYRKNFKKDRDGKYINLDFGHLIDLSLIDLEFRRILLDMSLNIEHAFKLEIIKTLVHNKPGDGYYLVKNFLGLYPDIVKSLDSQKHTPYNQDLFIKFKTIYSMPMWAILELLSFSQLILLAKYSSDYLSDKKLKKLANQMYDIKDIRNACAHDNCLLNDLTSKERLHKPSFIVTKGLGDLKISKSSRENKLSNIRVYQITALLLFHKRLVKNILIQRKIAKNLHQFKTRLFKNHSYTTNTHISSFFNYLTKLIDNWYCLY